MSRLKDRVTAAQVRREMDRGLRRAGRRRARIGAAIALALALAAGALAARFLFVLADIRTAAMGGALRAGDVVLCDRAGSPLAGEPSRGALVLIGYADNGLQRQAVRRIVGLPGDVISVDSDGRVTLNGAELAEDYALYRAESRGPDAAPGGALGNPFVSPEEAASVGAQSVESVPEGIDDQKYPLTVPGGRLFVLCDDREDLMDSRSSGFGLVDERAVLGWPRLVLWPAHRAGTRTDGRT